jgi:rubrerythrin
MRIEEKNGDLMIVDFDELEAFKIASKIEKDGINFYEKLAEKVEKGRVRDTLNLLAGQERDHLEFFGGELFKLREKRQDRFEEDDLLSSIDYGIFQPYRSIEELEKALDAPRKVLRMGLVIEEKSIRFYELCLRHISSPEAQDGVAGIIEEEREHRRLLEDMLAELT